MTVQATKQQQKQIAKRKIFRDMSKCMLCGRCRNFCPTGAIKFDVEEKGKCTHCNLCAEVCPVKAIDSYEGKIKPEEIGLHYSKMQSYSDRKVKVNCVTCMRCYENCPVKAIVIEDGKPFIKKGDANTSIINCSLCSLCVKSCPTDALSFQLGRVKLNPELCVLCGECVRVCPPKTMYLKDRYPGGYCVMCGRCVKSCPVGALSIKTVSWDGRITDDCIRCGTCSRVCPTEAISFNPITEKKPVVDVSKCILCEICASDCPKNAIPIRCSLPERKLVEHRIYVNRDMCIGCALCVEACKITLKGDHAPYLKDGLAYIDEKKCIGCGACATTCPAECIRVVKVYDTKYVSGRADDVVVFP
ncbi:MAG: 4Fe-4S binding protein [Candidatus Methanosuratincola sp.]